ncbi:MAG: NADH:ubiquinone oxidoreductase [Proteobacteria bacterium]|nr:NADH:ubiquinone oxidoreductase [Pseudomonadota bacterium]
MQYLGIKPHHPKIAVFDFTGCEGCQLQLANREESLGAFLTSLEIVNFREISSEAGDDYEIAFIDGAISRSDEIKRLKNIRSKAKTLVAMGSCACFGGVNRLKNAFDLDKANAEVYGNKPKETDKIRSIKEIVTVDLEIPGCPVSKTEIERIVQHVMLSVPYSFPVYPVCVECKQQFITCMFDLGGLCLGSITRAGCNAPCPAGGLGCYGCRGPAEAHNLGEFLELASRNGFSKAEIDERLGFFGGF